MLLIKSYFKEETIMALVVQHNITAMNANRQLGIISGAQGKATEKLSSGYRINRAGDDAAGLTISEKMRSQIRGLDKASTNAQDGISLIQSAEGALNEAHSILQRMNELAVQGANDTNEQIDRDAINKELNQLTEELDRIASTTEFNKQNLLDGSFQNKNLHVGANANQKIAISIDEMSATGLGLRSISFSSKQEGASPNKVVYNGMSYAYAASKTKSVNLQSAKNTFSKNIASKYVSGLYVAKFDRDTGSVYYQGLNTTSRFKTAGSIAKRDGAIAISDMKKALSANFGQFVVTSAKTAGTAFTTTGQAKVDTYADANATIKAVQEAINKVSTQRSTLGALQNRLEHTVANLDTVSENTSAAESRIRDTDMATQMVEYSKNNILAQAGQSMLAQANQSTQGVLSLLG